MERNEKLKLLAQLIGDAPVWTNGTKSDACEQVADYLLSHGVEVGIVHCKDCSWRDEDGCCLNPHCTKSFYGCMVADTHFCSLAEKAVPDYINRAALIQKLKESAKHDALPDSWEDGYNQGICLAILIAERRPVDATGCIDRRELIQKLHNAGGCGAEPGSWADGYDKGIDLAIKLVEDMP